MKKLTSLLLLFLLACFQMMAYNVYIKTNTACRYGNSALSVDGYPTSNSWKSVNANTFAEYSPNRYFHIGGTSIGSYPGKVTVNGQNVKITGNGRTTNPYRYSIDLNSCGDYILIEVYANSGDATYTYNVDAYIEADSGSLTDCFAASAYNGNYDGSKKTLAFTYSQLSSGLKIQSDQRANSCTLDGNDHSGSNNNYTFYLQPKPNYTPTIRYDNVGTAAGPVYYPVTVMTPYPEQKIVAVKYQLDGVWTDLPVPALTQEEIDNFNSLSDEEKEGYKITEVYQVPENALMRFYCAREASTATWEDDNMQRAESMTWVTDTSVEGAAGYYDLTNAVDCRGGMVNFKFIVIEQITFTVNVGNGMGGTFTGVTNKGEHLTFAAGNNSVTLNKEGGTLTLTPNEGINFSRCDIPGLSYQKKKTLGGYETVTYDIDAMTYKPYQATPVVINSFYADPDTDMSGALTGGSSNDDGGAYLGGATIYVETVAETALPSYNVIVEADVPGMVSLEVGTNNAPSAGNRTVSLIGGPNNVTVRDTDTYIVLSKKNDLNGLYSVTADGASVDKAQGQYYHVVPVSRSTMKDKQIQIEVLTPEVGENSLTITISDTYFVTAVKRMKTDDWTYSQEIPLETFTNGVPRTVVFNSGEYIKIFTRQEASSVVASGLSYEYYYGYELKDLTNGASFTLNFPEPATFTLRTDHPEYIQGFAQKETSNVSDMTEIVADVTELPFTEGSDAEFCYIYLKDEYTLQESTLDGHDLSLISEYGQNYFFFRPNDESVVRLFFDTPPVPSFTVNVDAYPTEGRLYVGIKDDDDEDFGEVDLNVGNNSIEYHEGYTYRIYVPYDAESVTLNGNEISAGGSKKRSYLLSGVAEGDVVYVSYMGNPYFTVNIDNVTKLNSFTRMADEENGIEERELSGNLYNGANRVDFTVGEVYYLWPKYGNTPLVVTIDDEPIERDAESGFYYFEPLNKSVINIYFDDIPGMEGQPVTLKFTAADGKTICDDFFSDIQVNDAAVSLDELLAGKTLTYNDELWFSYERFNHRVNSLTINGVAQEITGARTITLKQDTEIVFDIDHPVAYTYTLNIDNPENIVVLRGDNFATATVVDINSSAERVVEGIDNLEEGEEPELDEHLYILRANSNHPCIYIKAVDGVLVNSVKKGGVDIEADENEVYTILTEADAVYNIVTETVRNNESFALVLDGEFTSTGLASMGHAERVFDALQDGNNIVAFNSRYDKTIMFTFSSESGNAEVYVNDVLQESLLETMYTFTPEDGDVVRVYTGRKKSPELNEVFFEFDNSFMSNPDETLPFTVLREKVQEVDVNKEGNNHELEGTMYTFYPIEGYKLYIWARRHADAQARPEDLTVSKAPARAENEGPKWLDIEQSIFINEPTDITVFYARSADSTPTGIETVWAQGMLSENIYNMQGIMVKANATVLDLHALPAGLYIFGGRKVLVK